MLVKSKDLYEMQTVKTLMKCQYNTAFHQGLHCCRDKSSPQRNNLFFGNHNLDPSIYIMGHSDFIISKSLKRLSNFLLSGYCLYFHTILQTFIEWLPFGLSLQGKRWSMQSILCRLSFLQITHLSPRDAKTSFAYRRFWLLESLSETCCWSRNL